MKWLLTGLCVIAIATTPVAASANVEGEAESADRIVIAYIPEHLQHRVPGHQHKHQAAPKSPSEGASELTGPELQVEKSRSGIIASSIFMGLGVGMAAIGGAIGAKADDYGAAFGAISLVGVGAIFLVGGSIGIGISSHRKREAETELRKLRHERETPQWSRRLAGGGR